MQVPGHAYLSFEGSQDLLAAMAHQQALRHEAGSTRVSTGVRHCPVQRCSAPYVMRLHVAYILHE